MTRAPHFRSMFVGLLCACAGCISAPPGSEAGADADDVDHHSVTDMDPSANDGGPDALDGGNDLDGSTQDSDVAPDAASDAGPDAPDQPDAGSPAYTPLRVYRIAMVLDEQYGVAISAATQALQLHLNVGLNAEITFGSPNSVAAGDEDLVWIAHESGQHFAESTFAVFTTDSRPLLATRTASWPPLNFANGAENIVTTTEVDIVDPRPDPAQFVDAGPLPIYGTPRGASNRAGLGAGVTPVALNDAGEPTVFAYEQNARMAPDPAGLTSSTPARRVGFAPDAYLDFTAQGWDLLDGAVLWAMSESVTPTLNCHILTEQTAAQATMLIRSRMRLHGCNVQILDSSSGELTGSDLVIVLPDAASSDTVGTSLAGVASPVLVLFSRSEALKTMGLTAEDSTAFATSTDSWTIRPPIDERLRTARTGNVQVAASATNFPALALNVSVDASSLIVAHSAANNSAVTCWAYDKGMQMHGRNAPARRVAMSSPNNADALPTREALELVDGAIQWLLDR